MERRIDRARSFDAAGATELRVEVAPRTAMIFLLMMLWKVGGGGSEVETGSGPRVEIGVVFGRSGRALVNALSRESVPKL